ncbi:MAG: M73 family metallopeptidase [Candidatus Nomurabacteria bacterium]|jgi:hypothetical protein|nr:M73 family metallopeptidase [Candidatus Nomurabacteria bacterium]
MSKKQEEEKRNKKALFAFIALFASAAIIIGSAFAFFSDYITGNGTVTAGTLHITGTPTYKLNGTVVPSGTINNFNPGDVIFAGMEVNNVGNKSAWLQTILDLGTLNAGIADYIHVCAGELTYITCDDDDNPYLTPSGGKITTVDFNNDSKNDIINGTGTGKEEETNGLTGPINIGYTIKFDEEALNSAQGKSVNFTLRINAMQYRNNPSPVWTTIEQVTP